MLFITNRYPKQGTETVIGREFDFELNENAATNSVFFCHRKKKETYQEIGSEDFLDRLKKSEYRQLLIYIHGFSNMPEDVFSNVKEFQSLCNKKKDGEVLVIPAIWPCDNDLGIVEDYWDDQKSADMSAFSYARVLQKFIAWRNSEQFNPENDPCLKRINILAHSMGNRVLRETLAVWDKYDLASGVPLVFRNTFLVAADIVNESLQVGERGEHICYSSRNVVVYHASDDLALRASKVSNLKNKIASRRLGHTGPEDMDLVPNNVYSVDCDDVNTSYDKPKGHSYFRSGARKGQPGKVFDHIFSALRTGRVYPDDETRRTSIIRKTK
ncbi:MAG: alpha/beta hydrolase [Pseudomonadota bacterium]|nr:alpha/beta hydrolase [Pseudomonadota bacterium]